MVRDAVRGCSSHNAAEMRSCGVDEVGVRWAIVERDTNFQVLKKSRGRGASSQPRTMMFELLLASVFPSHS